MVANNRDGGNDSKIELEWNGCLRNMAYSMELVSQLRDDGKGKEGLGRVLNANDNEPSPSPPLPPNNSSTDDFLSDSDLTNDKSG